MAEQISLFDKARPRPTIPAGIVDHPKIDLHRHLLGSISPAAALIVAREHQLPLPSDSLTELTRLLTIRDPVDGLKPFFQPWRFLSKLLLSPQVVSSLIYHALKDAHEDHVIYVELRATWGMTGHECFSVKDFLRAAKVGLTQAEQDFGVFGRIVFGVTRHLFARHTARQRQHLWSILLDAACQYRDSVVVGFDLSGIEDGYAEQLFSEEFKQVAQHHFPITIHCGETTPPQHIWNAIEFLHPARLGHALTAVSDDRLLKSLADLQTPIEICPTSNWLTKRVHDLSHHPMKTMHAHGLKVTINTDDPAVCNTNLSTEYALVASEMGFAVPQIEQLMENSLTSTFANSTLRRKIMEKWKWPKTTPLQQPLSHSQRAPGF